MYQSRTEDARKRWLLAERMTLLHCRSLTLYFAQLALVQMWEKDPRTFKNLWREYMRPARRRAMGRAMESFVKRSTHDIPTIVEKLRSAVYHSNHLVPAEASWALDTIEDLLWDVSDRKLPMEALRREAQALVDTTWDAVKSLLGVMMEGESWKSLVTALRSMQAVLDQTAEPALDTRYDTSAPGSPEALAEGCTCPIRDNRNGKGCTQDDGGPWFVLDMDCLLHGQEEVGSHD